MAISGAVSVQSEAARLANPSPTRAHLEKFALWYAVAAFAAMRALLLAVALTAPQHRAGRFKWWSDIPTMRWDAGHYRTIALNGYPPVISDTTAFFPAYPVAAWPLTQFFGVDLGLVVFSHLTALLGALIFFVWARGYCGPVVALISTLLLSAYPGAMFFSTGYSEGFYFLCIASCFLLLQREKLVPAALLAGICSATRPPGVILGVIVMVWAVCRWRKQGVNHVGWRLLALGLLSVSGLLAHEAHLWAHYGRPDAYFVAQSYWSLKPVARPWNRILTLRPILMPTLLPFTSIVLGRASELANPLIWNQFWNTCITVAGFAGLFRSKTLPRALFLLPVLTFLMSYLDDPVTGGRMIGIARYQLVALPSFMLLAQWRGWQRWPELLGAAVVLLLVLQCCYMTFFVDWILVS